MLVVMSVSHFKTVLFYIFVYISKDNIVYFSASSVGSSDPIVSTDGLGSSQSFSTTVSSVEEQPYRPSFTRKWGNFFIHCNWSFYTNFHLHIISLIHRLSVCMFKLREHYQKIKE